MAEAMLTNPSTSKDLSETVDGLTVCSICLDTLKVPKYFSCLHTFCLACINGYLENIFRDRIPRSVSCPVCRTKIKVPDSVKSAEEWSRKLPLNYIIQSLVDAKKMQKGKSHYCSPCKKIDQNKESVAKFFCVECKETLCEGCSKYHKAFKAFTDHEVVEISKISDVHLKIGTHYNTCSEHLKQIELYCEDHQKPCCLHCITLEHRKCNDVMAIDEAAKNLRDGDAYLNLMNAFGSLTRYFNKAIEQRKKRLIDCQLEEKTRKHTIQSIREDIEKHLFKLEQKCFDQLSFSCGANISTLFKNKKEFEEKRKMVLHCQNMLKAGLQSNSDIQLLYDYKNMQDQKEEFETFLTQNQDLKHTKVSVDVKTILSSITEKVTSFASISEEEVTLTDINNTLLKSSILPRTDLHIRSALPSEAKLSGVACHEGRILLVDRYKSRLYIFENECDDRFGQVKFKISGTKSISAPWDVCGSLSGRCIVTFPECNVLADVDIIAQKVVHCIHVDSPQIGISYYNNTMVTCHRTEDHSADKVYIRDMTGKVLREHRTCGPNYLCTDGVGRIYFSKREENKLICMTYDFKPVFTYNHEQLGGISGITTDEEGNIYIAGFASNNVHQITPDGKFIRIILTESDGISNPRGISFKQDCNIIIVLNNSGEQIDLFELV
jgi:hypothetical protein